MTGISMGIQSPLVISCPCVALPRGTVVVDKRELENLRKLERRIRHSQIGKYNLYICEALAALEKKA